MEHKRFLTAAEVFQLFGVDSHALDELVEHGEVQALADMGTYKYRSEDFAKLIQAGKLRARTSAEMFQVDDEGDFPFLKIKKDDGPSIEDMSFIELDESALDDAAEEAKGPISLASAGAATDTWFLDDEHPIPLSSVTSGEIPVAPQSSGSADIDSSDSSEFELVIEDAADEVDESDSNVRLVDDEGMISFDDSDIIPSGSDSDVRLEGPVSLPRSTPPERPVKSGTDSDVRLSSNVSSGDSDVVMLSDAGMATMDAGDFHDSEISLAMPAAKKPDSDSNVRIAPAADSSDVIPTASAGEPLQTDSDIVLVGFPGADIGEETAEPSAANRAESDSDVTLVPSVDFSAESEAGPGIDPFAAVLAAAPDSDLNLAGGKANLEEAKSEEESVLDFPVVAETSSDEIEVADHQVADLSDFQDSNTEFELILDADEHESDDDRSVTLHDADLAAFLEDQEGDTVDTSGAVVDHGADLFDKTILLESSSDANELSDDDLAMDALASAEETASVEEDVAAESGISLEAPAVVGSDESFEMPVELVSDESAEIPVELVSDESAEIPVELVSDESAEIPVELVSDESAEIPVELVSNESAEIPVELVSDESFEMPVMADSGISLESAAQDDSGISLEDEKPDSGLSLAPMQTDSEIAFANLQEDSGIRLEPMDGGSGIMLEPSGGDSGIMLEPSDSGIRLESTGDSGISIMAEDSGISLEDDDLHATFADGDVSDFDQSSRTADLEIQDDDEVGLKDSGFDLSLKGSDNTIELDFDEDDEPSLANTVVSKEKGDKSSSKKSLNLSEAFQLDEPIEVEDLDISEDLDAAGFESSEEFASIDDEVLDVDDEHFSSGVVSIAEDGEEIEEAVVAKKAAKAEAPAKPKRPKSNEPEWGLAAVGPIIASAVALLVTTTVLWGGIATMWSGAEAPGPAAMLISTLAGLSPW